HWSITYRTGVPLAYQSDKTYLITDAQTSYWHRFLVNGVPSTVASLYERQRVHRYEQGFYKLAEYGHKVHHPCHEDAETQTLGARSWSSLKQACAHYG